MPCRKRKLHSETACPITNIYRFIEPVVLYLLMRSGGSYGYEMQKMLAESALTDASIDGACLYRTLQRLQDNGFVTSAWETAQGGPPRHKYRLTSMGVEHLREWVAVLEQLSRSLAGFVADAGREIENGAFGNRAASSTAGAASTDFVGTVKMRSNDMMAIPIVPKRR